MLAASNEPMPTCRQTDAMFEELDRRPTPMGDIVLRRRHHPVLRRDLTEVILGDEHLMSDLFTTSEVALAELGLAACDGDRLDVLVGGLGLGFTAGAVLADQRVRRCVVVDALEPVVSWHREALVPSSPPLASDERCELVVGDFFARVRDRRPFCVDEPDRWDVIALDVDHTPRHHLHPSHASFYEADGLALLADRIRPGGIFALWSDDDPDEDFLGVARSIFASAEGHRIEFPNPHTGGTAANSVIVAVT